MRWRCLSRWPPRAAPTSQNVGSSRRWPPPRLPAFIVSSGQHGSAKSLDEQGLALAEGGPEPTFDALLGLAADSVGLGDAPAARGRLAEAAAIAEPRGDWWRQKVELAWVQAEAALLEGNPGSAIETLSPAITSAELSGAPRYVSKSLLFLGVAQVQSGQLPDAEATLATGRPPWRRAWVRCLCCGHHARSSEPCWRSPPRQRQLSRSRRLGAP